MTRRFLKGLVVKLAGSYSSEIRRAGTAGDIANKRGQVTRCQEYLDISCFGSVSPARPIVVMYLAAIVRVPVALEPLHEFHVVQWPGLDELADFHLLRA